MINGHIDSGYIISAVLVAAAVTFVLRVLPFGLKKALAGISQANIAVRNFPLSAVELRRRLRLKDGGDVYLFATTDAVGRHWLLVCSKAG